MPHYKSRSTSRKIREKKRVRAQVPRDKRKIGHWAVRGTHKDYQKLRDHAVRQAPERPSYVTEGALDLFQGADRRKLLEANMEHDNHWFTDGLAWLLDKVPRGSGLDWLKGLGQAALKPFRGDHMSEVDEQYARLLETTYNDKVDRFEHWQRQPEFDSNYVQVFDNDDGHRFVAVRGTKLSHLQDLGEDLRIGFTGRPDNLIGEELKRVLDHTEPGRLVDVGGHSLGTSLITSAFDGDDTLQDRVNQTYLFNPAMSPLTENVTQEYEGDDRVRYFIDLLDPVSVGGIGEKGPKNVVYRTSYNPHNLVNWGGATLEHDEMPAQHHKEEELPYDTTGDGLPNDPVDDRQPVVSGDDVFLDFGDDYTDDWKVHFGAWDDG
jgi:hypothetical protein